MSVQWSTDVRNAICDAIEATIGASPTLELRTGAPPATPADADSGTLLASIACPADWMEASASGVKVLKGVWSDPSADNAGVAGHYRLKASGVCKGQGTASLPGGGGDMILDNTNIAASQAIAVGTFTLTAPGA